MCESFDFFFREGMSKIDRQRTLIYAKINLELCPCFRIKSSGTTAMVFSEKSGKSVGRIFVGWNCGYIKLYKFNDCLALQCVARLLSEGLSIPVTVEV